VPAERGALSPTPARRKGPVAACQGQPIRDIVVITQPPFNEKLPARLEWVRRTVRGLHVNTREEVIRRFLLFRVGERCDPVQRAESERILRAQPYLVDARIQVYDDEAGGVRLEVETRDDFSLLLEPRLNGKAPIFRGIRFGETNLAGTATSARLEWREGLNYNDILGLRYTDYQFAGGRNELRITGQRNLYGQQLEVGVVRPYYTDLQRFAWTASMGGTRDPQRLLRGDLPSNGVTIRREYAQVGALVRSGDVGRLRLIGGSLTRELERTDDLLLLLGKEGARPDTVPGPRLTFGKQHVIRANAMLGFRAIRFVRVQGFDALTGTQDIRVGVQLGVVAGQSIRVAGAVDRDRMVATNIYLGAGGQKWFLGAQGITEARYNINRGRWDNVIGSGRTAWYFRPAVRQTTILQAEWSGARRMQSPFQLSLADPDGGLLGHRRSQIGGARRFVLRGEQRMVIPARVNVADLGLAVFSEAGRMWAESSVPYSQDTPWRGAVGVSILAATPPKSRRLWRVDFALPLGNDPRRVFEVRVIGTDRSRIFWRDPRDVENGRERTAPASLFTWP
jgi:hypothetical protein